MLRDSLLLHWSSMLRNGCFNSHSLHTTLPEEHWDLQHQYLHKTHLHRPLPTLFSNHPQVVKEGMFSCLFHRAQTVARGLNMVTGEHLRGILEGNGISRHVCKKQLASPIPQQNQLKYPKQRTFIPYVAGLF